MGEFRVQERQSPCVQSLEEMVGRFQAELISDLPGWKVRLRSDPAQLGELEREVQAAFARGGDLLIVGLLAVTTNTPEIERACQETRRDYVRLLRRGRCERFGFSCSAAW